MNFMGYKRPDGSVGIRNHVLILPGCACASETCRVVASQVSGAVNIINNSGCAEVKGNEDMTQKILVGFAANPNVYGVVVIGLGCENVSHSQLRESILKSPTSPSSPSASRRRAARSKPSKRRSAWPARWWRTPPG